MRKTIILIFTLFMTASLTASGFSLELKTEYLMPTEDAFNEVYGNSFSFGVEAAFSLSHRLEIYGGVAFLSKEGKLTFTDEKTTLKITPLTIGLRYFVVSEEKIKVYAGAGIGYFFFDEKNIIQNVDENKIGFIVLGGVQIGISQSFFLDIFLKFSSCSMNPVGIEFNIGGFHIGAGVGYRL